MTFNRLTLNFYEDEDKRLRAFIVFGNGVGTKYPKQSW